MYRLQSAGGERVQNGRIYRKGSAWILSYAVKAQEPDGKITWARLQKDVLHFGANFHRLFHQTEQKHCNFPPTQAI
jgi:hypothetical protein